ncbi:MAG TPA: peptidase S16 [Rhodospirillales bacterium]|nr:peptidase S16 [Rhodospirillales bacterium]
MPAVGGRLPEHFPVFPLRGALLLPGGNLPLRIFEPRYLVMLRDAMRTAEVIGMVQPRPHEEHSAVPALYRTGCLGRITRVEEREEGRYAVTLTGMCRFDIVEEMPVATPYRQVRADFGRWRHDLEPADPLDGVRERLMPRLRTYLETLGIEARWSGLEEAPLPGLVTTLAMVLPFAPDEKQAFVEAHGLADQAELLITLLEMALAGQPEDGLPH